MPSLSYLNRDEVDTTQKLYDNGFAYPPLSSPILDLRSDVVIPPTEAMWEAIHRAGFSGTPLNDDLVVKELEALGADLLGKEAALFVPTCTVANLLAMMTLGERGTKVVLEKTSHIATSEEWGLAYVCGLVPHLIEGIAGRMQPAQIREAITNERTMQSPNTSLLSLENSHTNSGGVLLDELGMAELTEIARRYGVAVHLDGARLFNSAAALKVAPRQLAKGADTVAISLNKGLGAPMGALLCGSTEVIGEAHTNARRIGAASIHKAGTMAAAGIVALNNREHLEDDNRKAQLLAGLLVSIDGLQIELATVQTNLVKVCVKHADLSAKQFVGKLAERGILALQRGESEVRFVLHRCIQEADVQRIAVAAAEILG